MNSPHVVHIFAGPSLFGTPFQHAEPDTLGGTLAWLPPARRGDIAALVKRCDAPGILGLADGTFHSYPSVAHTELRDAVQQGWLVYGLCSMGAIRACEMQHMGVRPFGRVAQMFCDDPDLPDDEVALVHATEAPYFPFSEPMVHIRAYLDDMAAQGLLDKYQHAELVSVMRQRWYAGRTFALLREQLKRIGRTDAHQALLSQLDDFSPYRLKQQDLMHFVEAKPWLHDAGCAAPIALCAADMRSHQDIPTASASDAPAFMLSSSLRSRSAEESLVLARPLALERGVSRVVDTTWLDRLGIPVYAAIRPNAARNSLNVHAGKGFTHAEAKIGAYMEAIEFSFAEFGRSRVTQHLATPLDILASFEHKIQFPDFCPSQHQTAEVQADDAIGVVEADELLSLHRKVLVPAELVHYPYTGPGLRLYGSHMNGLASGNTVEEATVHALAEVMERHVDSFLKLGAASRWVDPRTLPSRLRAMVDRFESAGLEFHLRYAPNEFGLAHLSGFVLEDSDNPAAMASGMGFHCNSDIAAVRAIAEAAQSRLTTIHGGRDDLVTLHRLFHQLGPEREQAVKARMRLSVADRSDSISFSEVPDMKAGTIEAAHGALTAGLQRAGLHHLARVVLTDGQCPFQVVRVIVPGAEHYNPDHKRVGPRLLRYFKENTAQP